MEARAPLYKIHGRHINQKDLAEIRQVITDQWARAARRYWKSVFLTWTLFGKSSSAMIFPHVSFLISAKFIQSVLNPRAEMTIAYEPMTTVGSPFWILDKISRLIPALSATGPSRDFSVSGPF